MSIFTELEKSINENAKVLNEKYETELSVKDVFTKNMSVQNAIFRKFCDHAHTTEEYKTAVTPLVDAVKLVNDQLRYRRLCELKSMKHQDAIRAYLEDRTFKGYAVAPHKDRVFELVSDVDIRLDAYAVLETVAPTEMDTIIDYCCIIADNAARSHTKNESGITKKSLSASYIALKKKLGWDKPVEELTKSELARELTEVVSKISCKLPLTMINADARWLSTAIIGAKDANDDDGAQFVKRDEKTVVRAIFSTMHKRYHKKAYPFQDQTRYGKNALTVRANKDMAEPETKPATDVPASDVTVILTESNEK